MEVPPQFKIFILSNGSLMQSLGTRLLPNRLATVSRANLHRVLGPIIADRDQEQCIVACVKFAKNEKEMAIRSPLRGPYPQIKNYRSGGTTLANRYRRIFDVLLQNCINIICDPLGQYKQTNIKHSCSSSHGELFPYFS